jgi:hypothetical protein
MSTRSILCSALAAIALLAGAAVLVTTTGPAPAYAQLSPEPVECACSRGTNLASAGAPVLIKHCQCGILSCAVVVGSGQLQCTR